MKWLAYTMLQRQNIENIDPMLPDVGESLSGSSYCFVVISKEQNTFLIISKLTIPKSVFELSNHCSLEGNKKIN
jgi:hypothetical protein